MLKTLLQKLKDNNVSELAIDFETALATGQASTEFYRPDFVITSCALAWGGDSYFIDDNNYIRDFLHWAEVTQTKLIAHNLVFEYGVAMSVGRYNLNWHCDTMRLVQLADGGANKQGMSLVKSSKRWLPDYEDHKHVYYEHLRGLGVKAGQEGANLHLLPRDMFAAYNIEDAKVTWDLYQVLDAHLGSNNWQLDATLYFTIVKLVAKARFNGVAVDRARLGNQIKLIEKDILDQKIKFRSTFKPQIYEIEQENFKAGLNKYKTEKGQKSFIDKVFRDRSIIEFNTGSQKHLARLAEKLGMEAKFRTPGGKPAFSRGALGQWGELGKLLEDRGTTALTLTQCNTLCNFSQYDNRWHVDMKVAATTTGRLAGAGGLNVQGLARKDPRLMGNMVADEGKIFISVDLSAGEPTVTTHFSKDYYYRQATFDMVGKEPYYDGSGVLLIDDIYLMGMSVSPMGKDRLQAAFRNSYDGMTFQTAWLKNPELIKTALKKDRAFHKILILGLGYSMGPKHMVESARKAGFDITLKEARAFFKEYWRLFADVRHLGDTLEQSFIQTGYLVNPFGFRLNPDVGYKSLNYFIQSSVSGIIASLCYKFFSTYAPAQFVAVIHDEVIFQIPITIQEEAKLVWQQAVDSLNEDLGWDVAIRTGWKAGKDFYEAK